jgi:rubrerythrin
MNNKHHCKRCNYRWEGKADPKACPSCKSYRWREEKRSGEK